MTSIIRWLFEPISEYHSLLSEEVRTRLTWCAIAAVVVAVSNPRTRTFPPTTTTLPVDGKLRPALKGLRLQGLQLGRDQTVRAFQVPAG